MKLLSILRELSIILLTGSDLGWEPPRCLLGGADLILPLP
jgi:hypothetical protein